MTGFFASLASLGNDNPLALRAKTVSSREGVARALNPSCKIHFANTAAATTKITTVAKKIFRPLIFLIRIYSTSDCPGHFDSPHNFADVRAAIAPSAVSNVNTRLSSIGTPSLGKPNVKFHS